MPSLIGRITLGFSLLGSTRASEDTIAPGITTLLSKSSMDVKHLVLDSGSTAPESKKVLMRRERAALAPDSETSQSSQSLMALSARKGTESHQVLLEQSESYLHREGASMEKTMATSESTPKWYKNSSTGPTPDKTKNIGSKTVVAVFISDMNSKQLTASQHYGDTVKLTSSSEETCKWLIRDSGEGLGHAYIQRGSGDGAEYLCEHEDKIVTSWTKCPWILIPHQNNEEKLMIRSAVSKKFLKRESDTALEDADDTVCTQSNNECYFKITIISLGWGHHHDSTLVSPTWLEIYLATDTGDHLKDNARAVAFQKHDSSSSTRSDSEVWEMIDARDGWTFLRNKESGYYLTDDGGTLELKPWTTMVNDDINKKWWFVEMPAETLAKNLLSSKRKDEVEDLAGTPTMTQRFAGNHTKRYLPANWEQIHEYGATDSWAGTKTFRMFLKSITFQVDT